MTKDPGAGLSAREREVMDIVHRLREVTATAIGREMDHPPSNATVRSVLRVLEEKGWVGHTRDGARFVYRATEPRERTKKRALGHVVSTFFDGSISDAVAALVGRGERGMSPEERERVTELLRTLEEASDS